VNDEERGCGLLARPLATGCIATQRTTLARADPQHHDLATRFKRVETEPTRPRFISAGTIPGFAVDPDGKTPHDAVIFYKPLN